MIPNKEYWMGRALTREQEAYLEWADSMFDHFRMLDVSGRQVHLSNQSARNDSDGRYYQFLFDIDLRFVEAAPASEPMETLKTEEVVQ